MPLIIRPVHPVPPVIDDVTPRVTLLSDPCCDHHQDGKEYAEGHQQDHRNTTNQPLDLSHLPLLSSRIVLPLLFLRTTYQPAIRTVKVTRERGVDIDFAKL